MLLINLEEFTDSELRQFALQEEIDDWSTLSRKELIEEIENAYEEKRNTVRSETFSHRFPDTHIADIDDSVKLPGVKPIPKHYNKTFIHLTQKDASWAYVFWNLSEKQYRETEEKNTKYFILRTIALKDKNNPQSHYDISITIHDKCWTVELPWPGRSYRMQLITKTSDKEEQILCQSNTVTREATWLNTDSQADFTPEQYEVLVKPLISRDGITVNCREVRNIICGSSDQAKDFS